MDIRELLNRLERDGTVPANLLSAVRELADATDDEDAHYTAIVELFCCQADYYAEVGRAEGAISEARRSLKGPG